MNKRRRPRARIAAFTVLAMLTGLLHASPAAAVEPIAADRSLVAAAWRGSDAQVRAAAERALLGSDEQVRAFLDGGWQEAQRLDEREAVLDAIGRSGPTVRAAGKQALAAADAGDQNAISTFLNGGWQQAADTDTRIQVNQLMAGAGPQVREASQAALDRQDPVALREFVDSGWQAKWVVDQRLRVNQAMVSGGPQVKAAAQRALDAGTPEALEQFLEYGWATASAHDDEVTSLTDLLAQAEAASALATKETQSAKDEGVRAKEAAEAARKAAEEAAAATEAARNNRDEAAAHAKRAAYAAEQAAQAARVAVGAAAAASRAARAAAAAASRTAAAAARAQQAAAAARKAAADAATNEAAADQARQKAEEASRIALEARHKLVLFVAVRLAIDAGMYAVDQANAAAANAEAAATANDNAIQAANAAGAGASEAVAAANRARAAATQARRAAQAAERYLNVARQAADAAQDAANRAVANAEAAARAAIEAAEHAGEAAEAANRATEHAKAATEAAIAAVDAANQASTVYEAARRADAERLAVAKDQGIEASRAAKAQYDALEQAADWDVEEAAKRDTQTNQLLALAQNPATPQADAVKAGRTAALNLTKAQGPHTREAALAALAASDDEVLVFARTGVARANGLDDRAAVMRIAVTENAALATAAQAALEGTDAQVRQFLRTQEYPGRYAQDRIKVNQILSTARANGDTVTAQRAQAALDAGTLQALRDFLDTGRFDAEAVGERVRVNQILAAADSGPEVKAAAQVALDGPPSYLRDFLSTDRYVAAERDNEAAAHLANVGGLLEKIHEVATTATTNALQAQEVAAKARGDAEQAIEYAKQATESATRAGEYAEQAQAYADDAKRSVEKAAAAVATARAAATRADTSARSAIRSATWAIVSHGNAVQAAQEANAAAKAAYDSAMEAHGDAEAAAAAAKAAFDRGMYNHQGNITKCMKDFGPGTIGEALEKLYTGQAGQAIEACVRNAIGDPDELAKRAYQNSATCVYLYDEGSQGYDNCIGAVLDPMFEAGQKMALFVAAIQAMTALFTPLAVGALVGCMLTVCGLVAGTLLTIGEVGLNFVNLFNGDQSLGQTILNLGQMALEALLLNGVGKLLSVGFQSIKALYQSKKGADAALTGLTNSNLTRMFGLEIGSCLRPRNLAREAGCWFTYVGNATFVSPGGLSYTTYGDGGQLHRLMHVLDHMQPDPTKTMHSVFVLRPGENVFEMIDSAWVRRADDDAYFIEIQANGRKVWCIPMGRVVGTHGEKHLWITTEEEIIGIPDLVTAFPRLNTDNKCKN